MLSKEIKIIILFYFFYFWNEGHSDHKDFVKFPTVITMPWGYNLRSEGSLFLSKILAIKVFGIWNEICKVYSHVNEKPGFVLLVL